MTRAPWVLAGLGAAGLVAGAIPLALALANPGGHHRGLVVVFGPLIAWAFIGTGLFAWWGRRQSAFGALMIAAGFAYGISGLIVASGPWLFVIGLLFIPLPYAVLFHILLAFPSGRLAHPVERFLVIVTYASATVGHWTAVLFQDSTRQGPPGIPANPVLITGGGGISEAIYLGRFAVGLVTLVGLAVILVRRWRAANGPQRHALAPVLAAGGVVMGLFAVWYVANLAGLPAAVLGPLEQARVVALATVPFAFLGGLLRTRVAQAGAISELVAQLGAEGARRRPLRDRLAEALADPSLTLAYWLPEQGQYVDADGRHVELPERDPDRLVTLVDSHGERVAALVHDASLADERDLVRAVAAAASLTLDNERLDAQLRAKVDELRSSRARIVESGDAARRRIERDLHDGAQQRLVSLALTLRLAVDRVDDEPHTAKELLDSARRDLEVALEELRELARGIHPAALSERGLDSALRGLAGRAPVPVELGRIPAERLPGNVEATAYFVVAEAVTNVARYAEASHATVRVQREDGNVIVEVSDDGRGGADPTAGTGLRGLSDRLSALEGRLEVDSRRGRGTTVRATIPCG